MKKLIPTLVVMTLIFAGLFAATSFVAASSVEGTGQTRTVTLEDPDFNVTATVIVPSMIDNSTANAFMFTIVNEENVNITYNFLISIYDNNVTWYNGTLNIEAVLESNTTGYINFTADTLPIMDDAEVNVTMNSDVPAYLDSWEGLITTVDTNTYMLRVTLISTIVSLLGVVIIIIILGKVLGAVKTVKKKGNK